MELRIIENLGLPKLEIKDFEKKLAHLQEEYQRLSNEIMERVRQLQMILTQQEKLLEVQYVLKRLSISWLDREPGRYEPAYWFLSRDNERVAVRELVPEGAYSQIAKEYQCIPFTDVRTEACSQCKQSRPLITSLFLADRTMCGDDWEEKSFIICCGGIQTRDERILGHGLLPLHKANVS